MNVIDTAAGRPFGWLLLVVLPMAAAPIGSAMARPAIAQEDRIPPGEPAGRQPAGIEEGVRAAEAALAPEENGPRPAERQEVEESFPKIEKRISVLELAIAGGPLMWPILAVSLLVVACSVERLLALRRRRVLPPGLIGALGKLAAQDGGLEPRQAYKLCQQFPSAASNVIRTMLLKVGRPHAELEQAITQASNREAARLYSNVRWLNLATGVAPLLGLLGTVQGMILAFFVTANLPTGANRADVLAKGIYMALVTTFAGLTVAIPAAVLAHFFEGRIQRLFDDLDEILLGVMPQLERFEGRLRLSKDQIELSAADPLPAARPPAAGPRRSQREVPPTDFGPPQPAATPK